MERSIKIQLSFAAVLILTGFVVMGWVFFTKDPRTSDITMLSIMAIAPMGLGVLLVNLAFIRWGKRPD